MLVTDDGIARLVNERHREKARSPILVTDDGIVTLVTFALSTPHSLHESAVNLMMAVPSGITKCIRSLPSGGSAGVAAVSISGR